MTTAKDILKRARETIKQGWCQGANARDEQNTPVPVLCDSAVKWCVIGAIFRQRKNAHMLCDRVRDAADAKNLVSWNDDPNRTQADVLAVFDKVIERCET